MPAVQHRAAELRRGIRRPGDRGHERERFAQGVRLPRNALLRRLADGRLSRRLRNAKQAAVILQGGEARASDRGGLRNRERPAHRKAPLRPGMHNKLRGKHRHRQRMLDSGGTRAHRRELRAPQRRHRSRKPHWRRLHRRKFRDRSQLHPLRRSALLQLRARRQQHRLLLRNGMQPRLPGPRAAPQQLFPDSRLHRRTEQRRGWSDGGVESQRQDSRRRNQGGTRLLARALRIAEAFLRIRQLHHAGQGLISCGAFDKAPVQPRLQQRT